MAMIDPGKRWRGWLMGVVGLVLGAGCGGPGVSFTAPAAGATVTGPVQVSPTFTGKISKMDLVAGGTDQGMEQAGPYEWTWDSCAAPDGPATLTATVTDAKGHKVSGSEKVTVANEKIAPALTASAGGRGVDLHWTVTCPAEATGYALYWSTRPGVTRSSTRIAVTGSAYTQTGLSPGATYHYRVAAVYPSGEGPLSPEVTATPSARAWAMATAGHLGVGWGKACAIAADGTLWCWGDNTAGSLGDGTYTDRTRPIEIGTGTWQSVALGYASTCAIDASGALWCFGANGWGQLGDGTTTTKPAPVRVGIATWTSVSAGPAHTCGIQSDGSLWCWGSDEVGQLGDGTTSTQLVTSPTQVAPGRTFLAVSAGWAYTCAIRADHTLWCFGDNVLGELGDGSTTNASSPEQIGTASDWTAIAAGYQTTCGIHGAGGTVSCWGFDNGGQAGNGSPTPSLVKPHDLAGLTGVTAVAVGDDQTCAIAQGRLFCWGFNLAGTVGDGTSTMRASPVEVGPASDWTQVAADGRLTCAGRAGGTLWCWGARGRGGLGDGTIDDALGPRSVATGAHFTHVTLQSADGCGIQTDGTLWCWGSANFGVTGFGGGTTSTDVPKRVGRATTWSDVALGCEGATACGVRSGGELWCWGDNGDGEVGDGTTTLPPGPVKVGSDKSWSKVALGEQFSSAVKRDGSLWWWGKLPDGTTQGTPVQVGTATDWTPALAAGIAYLCDIRTDGSLWCLGAASAGQLGSGGTSPSMVPVEVGTAKTWQAIAAGDLHACGLRTDGTLWCWGANDHGALGTGAAGGQSNVPVQVAPGKTWSAVTAGNGYTCGAQTNGTVWCWGANGAGNLGDGTAVDRDVPVKVGGVTAPAALVAGDRTACAVGAAGTLRCWGTGQEGELADGTAWARTPQQVLAP